MNRVTPLRAAFLSLFLVLAFTATGQETAATPLIGTWSLEDAYTVHADNPDRMWIESHEAGRFAIELIMYSDGTGVLDGNGFSWAVAGDAVLWEFGGRVVRVLPRPIDEDTILLLAMAGGDFSGGSAISVLHRQR